MKIILNQEDKTFLQENNFIIDYSRDYSDDEFLKLLDDLYFQEVSYTELNETLSNKFADIADKVATLA